MNRARLLPVIAVSLFVPVNAVAADPPVTVSTVPPSFKAGEQVKVHVEIIAPSGLPANAKLELQIMDASKVFLSTSQNPNKQTSYTFPDTFTAPSAPQGDVLTFAVFLLEGDEVYVGEPGNPYVGVRRFLYRCTAGAGRKEAKPVCDYKTPAQRAIEGSAKHLVPTPNQ